MRFFGRLGAAALMAVQGFSMAWAEVPFLGRYDLKFDLAYMSTAARLYWPKMALIGGGSGAQIYRGSGLGFRVTALLEGGALEWSGAILDASAQSDRVAAAPLARLQSGQMPVGQIDLSAQVDATGALAFGQVVLAPATDDRTRIEGYAFTPAGEAAAITQFARSQTSTGAAFLALTTHWKAGDWGAASTSAAYGAIMDENGFFFTGTGDLSDMQVRHHVKETLHSTRQSLAWIWPIASTQDWAISGRIGPTQTHIRRNLRHSTQIDLAETVPGSTLPALTLIQSDQIIARALGLIGGLAVTRQLGHGWSATADLRLGLAHAQSDLRHQGSSSIGDKAVSQPIQFARHSTQTQIGVLTLELARQINDRAAFSVAVMADYQSKVPTLDLGPDDTAQLDFGKAHGLGVAVNYTYRF